MTRVRRKQSGAEARWRRGLARRAACWRARVQLGLARSRGLAWIPHPRLRLYIEPTGICNLACRFCGYKHKEAGKVTMPAPRFEDVARQAASLGFSWIGLTPLTGEVFMDRDALAKMRVLEELEGIERYHFFTNLCVARTEDLEGLFGLKKLWRVFVSLYGHDRDAFGAITQREASQYDRLLENLRWLRSALRDDPSSLGLVLSWRTARSFDPEGPIASPVHAVVRELESLLGRKATRQDHYNNWGGLIGAEDVADLDIEIDDGRWIARKGPCAMLFGGVIVLADGRVNACMCRDVHGTLRLGDVREKSLGEILSLENPVYAALIEDQRRGDFPPVCRSCDFYRSIHAGARIPHLRIPTVSQAEATRLMSGS